MRSEARRLLAMGAVALLAAAALWTARLAYFGSRPAYIHVRWAPSVSEPARHRAESRYGLADPDHREGSTWSYMLTDVSRANIEALVTDAAVDDTHNIHRTAFRPWRTAPRTRYRTTYPLLPAGLDVLGILAAALALGALGLGVLGWKAPSLIRGPVAWLHHLLLEPRAAAREIVQPLGRLIIAGIPRVSAEAVAVFRVAFGVGLLWVVLRQGNVEATWATNPTNPTSALQSWVLGWVASVPALAAWIRPWVITWGLLFVAGAWARMSFAMLTIGVFAWAMLMTTQTTFHSVCALLTALIALLWSRWGDAWSVDAWRVSPRAADARHYGYTTWIPGVVLGVTFAAAALAKLRESGVGWILNGTVKYHFLVDSRQAPLDWGLFVGPRHWLAVALSFAAIAVESLVILAALSGVYRYRVAAGIAAVLLLSGFTFLQGIFWPGWWLLILSFLPWHRIRPPADPSAVPASAVGRTPGLAIASGLIAAQLMVSTLRLEGPPLISTYDMYATTYDSPEDFVRKAGEGYLLVATDEEGNVVECRLTLAERQIMVSRQGDNPEAAAIMRKCFPPSLRVRHVTVDTLRIQVDWDNWRLMGQARVRVPAARPSS